MSNDNYMFVEDGDGHEYLIPKEKLEDFFQWLDSADCEEGIEPYYAERLYH